MGMKVLHKIGVCPEDEWPYRIAKFKEKPDYEAEAAAGAYRIEGYHRIHDLAGIKAALADGQPVVFGIWLYAILRKSTGCKNRKDSVPESEKRADVRRACLTGCWI